MRHHPWRDLRSREDVIVSWRADLPPPYRAVTDGRDIWMSSKLLQVERRCTLTHELVHMDLGHADCQDEAVEARVRRVTARRLLSAHQLVPVAQWTQSVEEAADELWVTPEVLRDFMASLSPVERLMVECAVRRAREP